MKSIFILIAVASLCAGPAFGQAIDEPVQTQPRTIDQEIAAQTLRLEQLRQQQQAERAEAARREAQEAAAATARARDLLAAAEARESALRAATQQVTTQAIPATATTLVNTTTAEQSLEQRIETQRGVLATLEGEQDRLRRVERLRTDSRGASEMFGGVGVGLTQNLGGSRAENITLATQPDGNIFVQVNESRNTDVRVLFETHHLFRNATALRGPLSDRIAAFAACGPFALVNIASDRKRGCGPFVAVAVEPDVEIAELGLGWFVGYGRSAQDNSGFGLGIGVIIDPDSQTLDGRVIDTRTRIVRPEFRELVLNDGVAITTREATTSLLFMVSKDFALD